MHTDNASSTPGDYQLKVTATLGLTSTLYEENITISGPLCGSTTAPSLAWKSTPLPAQITYSVGSSENKEIVLDPATYIQITNPGSPACSIGDIIMTIDENIFSNPSEPDLEASVWS